MKCTAGLPRPQLADLALWAVVLVWWGGSLWGGFFQDDFLLLWLTKFESFEQLVTFWKPIEGFPYRPLGTFLTYFFIQLAVGANPFWFHVMFLLLFGILVSLVYRLALTISDQTWAFTWALLFSISAVHYMSMYWLASFYFAQGVVLAVLALWCYQRWRVTLRAHYGRWYLCTWVLAALTNDALVFLPLIALLLSWWQDGTLKSQIRLGWVVSLGIAILLISFRLVFAGTPAAPDYQLVMHPISIAKTSWWYGLRTLGLPEAIRAMTNPSHVLGLVGVSLASLGGLLLTSAPLKKVLVSVSVVMVWWLLGLQPFSLLPYHLSPYYLTMAMVAIVGLSRGAKPISGPIRVSVAMLAIITWAVSQSIGLNYYQNQHWVGRRQALATQASSWISSHCGSGEVLVVPSNKDTAEEIAISLHRHEGAAVLCPDATLYLGPLILDPDRARTL